MMDIDDLRKLCATEGKTDDEAVLDFYTWQDAQQWADTWMDDGEGIAEALHEWFRDGLKAATIAEVKTWLADFFNPDAIGGTMEEMKELHEQWVSSR